MRKFLIWGALLLSFITAPLAHAEINPNDPLTQGIFQSKFYSDKPWFAMEENGFVVGYGLYNDHKGKPVIFSKNYDNYIIGGTFYIRPDCTDDSYDLCVIGNDAEDYVNAWFYNKSLIVQTLSSFRIFTHNGSRYTASENYLYDHYSASKMGLYEIDDGSYNTPYILFVVCYGGGAQCDYIMPYPDASRLVVRIDWRDESFIDSAGTFLSNEVGLIRTFNNNRSDNQIFTGKKFTGEDIAPDGTRDLCYNDPLRDVFFPRDVPYVITKTDLGVNHHYSFDDGEKIFTLSLGQDIDEWDETTIWDGVITKGLEHKLGYYKNSQISYILPDYDGKYELYLEYTSSDYLKGFDGTEYKTSAFMSVPGNVKQLDFENFVYMSNYIKSFIIFYEPKVGQEKCLSTDNRDIQNKYDELIDMEKKGSLPTSNLDIEIKKLFNDYDVINDVIDGEPNKPYNPNDSDSSDYSGNLIMQQIRDYFESNQIYNFIVSNLKIASFGAEYNEIGVIVPTKIPFLTSDSRFGVQDVEFIIPYVKDNMNISTVGRSESGVVFLQVMLAICFFVAKFFLILIYFLPLLIGFKLYNKLLPLFGLDGTAKIADIKTLPIFFAYLTVIISSFLAIQLLFTSAVPFINSVGMYVGAFFLFVGGSIGDIDNFVKIVFALFSTLSTLLFSFIGYDAYLRYGKL